MMAYTGEEMQRQLVDCSGSLRSMTVGERLVQQQARLSAELANVEKALELLDNNPEVNEILQALSKVGNYF